jgi:O-antigen/teichoic acid export membrane protein
MSGAGVAGHRNKAVPPVAAKDAEVEWQQLCQPSPPEGVVPMNPIPKTLWRYLKSGPALNLWAGYFCFASTALYGILSLPLAVRFLDKEQLGLWNLVTQVVGYLLWLDLGVTTMTGRTLAQPIQNGVQSEIDRTWSTILFILAAQAALIIGVGAAGLPHFLSFFEIPSSLVGDAAFVFFGTVLVTALSLPLRAIPGVFLCQDRLHWSMIIQGTMPWVNLAIFWLMLASGHGVRSFVYSTAIVNVCQFFWFRSLLKSGSHPVRFRPRMVSLSSIKPVLGFSSSMMLWSMAPAAIASIPAVVIGRQLGLDQVSIYNVTSRVPVMLASVALRTYHSFYPRIQKYFVAGDTDRFVSLFRLSTWLSVWVSGIFLAAGVFMNPMVVGFLARPDFFGGHMLSILLASSLLVVAVAEHLGSLFYCSGRPKLISPVLAIEVVATFIVAAFLCARFGLAGIAAAIAFMPVLIRIPYSLWNGPRACGTTFLTLYAPGLTGFGAILALGWGGGILAGITHPSTAPAIGWGLIAAGLVLSALSLRAGWLEWKRYRGL